MMKRNKTIVLFSILLVLGLALGVVFLQLSAFSRTGEGGGRTLYVGKSYCNNHGPGTKDKPFCTIQSAIKRLEAGDTLIVLPGTYTQGLVIENKSGTKEKPIVIRGTSNQEVFLEGGCPDFPCLQEDTQRPWRAGLIQIINSKYIVIEELTIRNAPTAGVFGIHSENIALEKLRIEGIGLSGVKFEDSKNIEITNNRLNYINQGWIGRQGKYSQAEESITIKRCENVEIAFNHISNSLQEGIDLKAGTRNARVHNNIVEKVNRVGIYINEADYIRVYENIIRYIGFLHPPLPLTKRDFDTLNNFLREEDLRIEDYIRRDGSLPTDWYLTFVRALKLKKIAEAKNIKVLLEEFKRNQKHPALLMMGVGVVLANGDLGDLEHPDRVPVERGKIVNIKVYRNLIHHTLRGGISVHNEWRKRGLSGYRLDNIGIFNNTIYKVNLRPDLHGMGIVFDFKITNSEIKNNIIAFAKGGLVIDKWGFSERGRTINAYKGKIPRTLDEIDVDVSSNLFYETPAPCDWYVVRGNNFIKKDPLFISPEAEDFRLQEKSPAIDHGAQTEIVSRGNATDIGAFGYREDIWPAGISLQGETIKEAEVETLPGSLKHKSLDRSLLKGKNVQQLMALNQPVVCTVTSQELEKQRENCQKTKRGATVLIKLWILGQNIKSEGIAIAAPTCEEKKVINIYTNDRFYTWNEITDRFDALAQQYNDLYLQAYYSIPPEELNCSSASFGQEIFRINEDSHER